MRDLRDVRNWAVSHAFAPSSSVVEAVKRMHFVQIDPIQAPTRAQDLILRQRVAGYRVGDLDRVYPDHDLEEGMLYAHGVVTRATWRLLHPRRHAPLSDLERDVLDHLRRAGPIDPLELDAALASEIVRNDWGGRSKATKCALECLNRVGLVRIVRRDRGRRVYGAAREHGTTPAADRLRELAVVVADVLAPVRLQTLCRLTSRIGRALVGPRAGADLVQGLVTDGTLRAFEVAGSTWLWPACHPAPPRPGTRVRFLAPFDPLVHDRERLERLWGWSYRFEAYTPPAKRLRGYYALPVLYGSDVVGWANANVTDGSLSVQVGLAKPVRSRGRFETGVRAEVRRFAAALGVEAGHVTLA